MHCNTRYYATTCPLTLHSAQISRISYFHLLTAHFCYRKIFGIVCGVEALIWDRWNVIVRKKINHQLAALWSTNLNRCWNAATLDELASKSRPFAHAVGTMQKLARKRIKIAKILIVGPGAFWLLAKISGSFYWYFRSFSEISIMRLYLEIDWAENIDFQWGRSDQWWKQTPGRSGIYKV